jgi:hypothetical protein
MDYTARTKPFFEFGILWIGALLRFLLGIQVIEIAEKFIETMRRRQIFIAVTKMIFAKLTGCIYPSGCPPRVPG